MRISAHRRGWTQPAVAHNWLLRSTLNLKAFLAGTWKIDRVIVDRALAMTGRLQGRATFTPSDRGLMYQERGVVTFGEHRGSAHQTFWYDFPESDGRASVRFSDGRAFHDLDLSLGQARVGHACDPDLYEGLFVALSSTAWRSAWTVTGPRKDYDLVTTYTRWPAHGA